MKLKLEIYDALCATNIFTINNITGDIYDFGSQYDESPEEAEDYCCGNMVFERKESTKNVLKKYNITEDEYRDICEKLESGLSFGSCGLCS